MAALPPVTTWAVHDDGLRVYVEGKLVATIPAASFGRLIYALAAQMRNR